MTSPPRSFLVTFPDHEEPAGTSLFQMFSNSLLELHHVFLMLVSLPASIVTGEPLRRALKLRAVGRDRPWLLMLRDSDLGSVLPELCSHYSPLDIIAHEDSLARVRELVAAHELGCRIVSAEVRGAGGLGELYRSLTEGDLLAIPGVPRNLEVPNHNVTAPNLAILSSAGIELENQRVGSGSNDVYAAKIFESIAHVRDLLQAIGVVDTAGVRPTGIGLILAVPGVIRDHAIQKKYDTRGIPGTADDRKALRIALRHSTKQRDYFHKISPGDPIFSDGGLNPYFSMVSEIRARELNLFTAGLCLMATSHVAPTIRLPPGVGALWNEQRDARDADEGRGRRASQRIERLSDLAYELGSAMREQIPQTLWEAITSAQGHIKLISDAPLELMPMSGIPMGMQRTVSRIGVTPGNLFFQGMLPRPRVHLSAQSVRRILVIRSYEPGDPIAAFCEDAVALIPDQIGAGIDIEFVDVDDEAEFVAALNESEAQIVVYDGHGDLDRDTGVAYLRLAEGRVDTWALRGEIERPPAVFMLLACSTHPLDGAHASVANGILTWGTAAVVGTHGLIDGATAAIMLARFVFWLDQLLIPFIQSPEAVVTTWAEMFGRFLRRIYTTEVIDTVAERTEIDLGDAMAVATLKREANDLSQVVHDWAPAFIGELARASGRPKAEITEAIRRVAYYPDAAKYIQLGRPEDVLLVPEHIGSA